MFRDLAAERLVDPRVALTRGTRNSRKSNYQWRGMADDRTWRRSLVHAHSSYGCFLCGQNFTGPHAVYTHLAKRHGR